MEKAPSPESSPDRWVTIRRPCPSQVRRPSESDRRTRRRRRSPSDSPPRCRTPPPPYVPSPPPACAPTVSPSPTVGALPKNWPKHMDWGLPFYPTEEEWARAERAAKISMRADGMEVSSSSEEE